LRASRILSMKGLVLGPGVVRPRALIAHCDCTPQLMLRTTSLVPGPHPYGETQHCWLSLQTCWRDFRLAHCSVVKEPVSRASPEPRELPSETQARVISFSEWRVLRDLMSSESGRSAIIPRPGGRHKPAQSETGTPPSSGCTSVCPCLVKYRTSSL